MLVMKNKGHLRVHEMLIKCCESEIISFHFLLVGDFGKKVEVMVMFTTVYTRKSSLLLFLTT